MVKRYIPHRLRRNKIKLQRLTDVPVAAGMARRLADALENDWARIARANQLPPPSDWRIWVMLAGRGFGKTRSGAEHVREMVETGAARRVALIGPTWDAARGVMVEGESGILAVCPEHNRPTWESSKRRLTWPNGATASVFSSEEPERLRGPEHDLIWADEVGTWRYATETWSTMMMGLRLGRDPRAIATTTPKPTALLRDLVKREGKDVVISRGTTYENRPNLAPAFFEQIISQYEGTRLGRQELNAELLDDVPGAFWSREMLDRTRVRIAPEMTRVVIGIDPSGSTGSDGDECGIVVCGIDAVRRGYLLEDLSGRYPPHKWARVAIDAYEKWKGDRIVAEQNFGGAMVESVLRSVDQSVSFKSVVASRGKTVRAEPVAALYEQNRISHVGSFAALEDQLCAFGPGFDRATAGFSPDRLDAMVWAFTELLGGKDMSGWVGYWQNLAADAIQAKREGRFARADMRSALAPVASRLPWSGKQKSPTRTFTVRTPRPHFYARVRNNGQMYISGEDALLRDVPEPDKDDLVRMGCDVVT